MSECTFLDKLRSPKIFDMAIFDWASTILVGYLLYKLIQTKFNKYIPLWQIILALIVLAVAVHYFMGIPTMLGYYLHLNDKPIRKIC